MKYRIIKKILLLLLISFPLFTNIDFVYGQTEDALETLRLLKEMAE